MEKRKLLEGTDIFAGLTPVQLDAIGEICTERRYKANEQIFAEGSKGQELYILEKGKVRLELSLKGNRKSATVHRISSGQTFGELALVDKGSRSATATCESDCQIVVIKRDDLFNLFETNSRIGYVVLRQIGTLLAARLRKTNLQLVASILWE